MSLDTLYVLLFTFYFLPLRTMNTRRPSVAGMFYPADEHSCRRKIEACFGDYQPPAEPEQITAGIVPHAGWDFSGPTAAKVYKSIKEKSSPETFVIFGAVHTWAYSRPSVFPSGTWETPLGSVAIDEDLAYAILTDISGQVVADASAHAQEHSIEVQIPFIQYLFPEAKIVPLMVAPEKNAGELGRRVGKLVMKQDKPILILGSTDLTHYGPRFGFTTFGIGSQALEPMKKNDQRIIDLAVEMKAAEVVAEAARNRNACGAGAIAATVAAAKELGSTRGYLLEHTTSQDIMPERLASDFVGYAGIIF